MTALETIIAEAVAGGLRGLTLWQLQDGTWQANTTQDRVGWRVEHGADPVEALKRALGASGMSETKNDNDGDVFG